MSEEYFYDRTTNLSGVFLANFANLTPTYESSVTFTSTNYKFDQSDNYYQYMPRGINNLSAIFNLVYQVKEEKAQEIVNTCEQSQGDNLLLVHTDPSIYKDISGYCVNYSIDHINNQNYKINISIEVTEAPGLMNWSGMNYLNAPEVSGWDTSIEYKKNDVVYYDVSDNKLNNFYYCTEDNTSSSENSPTGVNSSWTQDFFWKPDLNTKNSVKLDVERWEAGYTTFNKTKKNTALVPLSYSFSNISTKQLKSMLHFLENKLGYRRFRHQIASVYNRPKVYICPTWTHSWVYYDSHNLQVTLEEDPLGVISKNG